MRITLSDKTPNDGRYGSYARKTDKIIRRVIPEQNAGTYDWQTKTHTGVKEVGIRTSMATEADAAHLNYLEALAEAWGRHRGITFTPDILWFGLLSELAKGVVEMPDVHRSLFTRSPDKITLTVPVGAADDPLPLNGILAQLAGLVPVPVDLFVPRFSTTTDMARFAHLAAFAEACSPYYSYMTMLCDIPLIHIEGEQADFDHAHDRAVKLHDEFARIGSPLAEWMAEQMVGLTGKVAGAIRTSDADFFRQIFRSERCGSGGEISVDGWWSRMFRDQPKGERKPDNFPTNVARVPWVNADTGRQFFLNCGVFTSKFDAEGVMVPEFHYIQTEKVA